MGYCTNSRIISTFYLKLHQLCAALETNRSQSKYPRNYLQHLLDDDKSELSASIAYQKLSHCESFSGNRNGILPSSKRNGMKHEIHNLLLRPYRVCTEQNSRNPRRILAANLKDLIKKGQYCEVSQ